MPRRDRGNGPLLFTEMKDLMLTSLPTTKSRMRVRKVAGLVGALLLSVGITTPLLSGGYPRADQLDFVYRLRIMEFDFADLVSHLDWNRSVVFWSAGSPDSLLFRPLSYLLNGYLVLSAGNAFWLPILVSILLHLGVVTCLYLLVFHATRSAWVAFGLVATLATSPFALELVAWTHLPGYLAFAFCVSLFCLIVQRALIAQNFGTALLGAGLISFSSFFYELGSFLALLFSICLILWRYLGGWPWLQALKSQKFWTLVLAYTVAGLFMPVVSAANYLFLYGANAGQQGQEIHNNVEIVAAIAGIFGAQWLIPLAFTLVWGTRLNWIPEVWPNAHIFVWMQALFALVLVTCFFFLMAWQVRRAGRRLASGILFLLFAPAGYAVLLAGGRAPDFETLITVLRINNYYVYFFIVILVASVGFLRVSDAPSRTYGQMKFQIKILLLFGTSAVAIAALSLPMTVQLARSEPGEQVAREQLLYTKAVSMLDESAGLQLLDTSNCDLPLYPWLLDTNGKPLDDGLGLTSIDALLYGKTVQTNDSTEFQVYQLCG